MISANHAGSVVLSACALFCPHTGDKVGGGGEDNVSSINSSEWIRYSVSVMTSGTYGLKYLLGGNPTTPVPLSIHIAVDSNGTCLLQMFCFK